ncbi:hypothetical protein BHM03_00057794 [Ensete ventricosum]|nr:hypothetical protein BHM03_00057794 [Ensete ventricosum]
MALWSLPGLTCYSLVQCELWFGVVLTVCWWCRFTQDTGSPDSLRWCPWNSHALSWITDARRCSLLSGRQAPIRPHRLTHSSFQWHLQILGFAPRCHRLRHRVPGHGGRFLRARLRRHLRQQPQPA